MARKGRARLRRLSDVVAQAHPSLKDPATFITAGMVLVDGRVLDNPASLILPDASITIARDAALRGEAKLQAALDEFSVRVAGRVALDIGAAAGGFTRVLLAARAARVYAVDVGFGQLVGSLRQDPRVVNLERTNVAELTTALVPDEIEIVTADLSYLALGKAVGQLNGRVEIASDAELVGLVKPQFELGLAQQPTTDKELKAAVRASVMAINASGWIAQRTLESPIRGSRGAVEFLVYASRETRSE